MPKEFPILLKRASHGRVQYNPVDLAFMLVVCGEVLHVREHLVQVVGFDSKFSKMRKKWILMEFRVNN
jgi:hypothetical protein